MGPVCEKLLGRLALWHGTSAVTADLISAEGFRPAQKSHQHTFREATWFYHVTSFTEGREEADEVDFILAVDPNLYVRGRDYVHEMDNTVVFKVPLSPDHIVARLDSPRGALVQALTNHWKSDVISEFAECCCDTQIPWSQKSCIAEMLWTLGPGCYSGACVPHLLTGEVPGLSLTEAERLGSLLREQSPRFLNGLLRLYHKVFLTPRFARAAMVAAARHLHPVGVLAFAEDLDSHERTSSGEGNAVGEFLKQVLPRLPSEELVRGAIEMAAMRHFPGNPEDIRTISDWVVKRASDAEDVAIHYIRFAGDTFPTRHSPGNARHIALRILRTLGKDYFDQLLMLSDTDYLETLTGVMYAFGELGEKRAVPFLVSRLKDDRKLQRASAVRALGKIGTPDALSAIQGVARDRRKVVRTAVQHALAKA